MDTLPIEIIQKIFQYIENPNDKKSFREMNKILKYSISQMQIKVLKIEKEVKKIEEKNEREKGCINIHSYKGIGKVLLYYPYSIILSEKEKERGIRLIIKKQLDFQANKRILKRLILSENKSKLFPLIISQEITKLSDNLLRKEDCKNGKCIERNIPYCWECIKKYNIIEEECLIIKKRKYNNKDKN